MAPPPAPAPTPAEAALPVSPAKVTVSLEGSTVVVKWNPAAGKLAGYTIYRAFPGDDVGAPLNGSPTSDTTFRDRTAQEGKTYVYWVVSQGADGKTSPPSGRQTVEVPSTGGVVPFF